MSKKDFLSVADLSVRELHKLFQETKRLKQNRKLCAQALSGKIAALVFQKPSMRTRVAFEVAVLQLGGSVLYMGQEDIQLGQREPIKDVARALSRYVDVIVARTFAHHDVEEFARFSRVPVINGLSDLLHPCQALADLFTIEEHFGRLKGLQVGYVGDGNNVLHALMQICSIFKVDLAIATPKDYRPDGSIWAAAKHSANSQGIKLSWCEDPKGAAKGSDILYTDVWASMGKEKEKSTRSRVFQAYQLNSQLLKVAKDKCQVMHCLPAHRGEEITPEMIDGSRSLVFDQAENRLHVQKALLLHLLEGKGKRQKAKVKTTSKK